MNLYFRLIWTLIRSWWLPAIEIDEALERPFRVLPNDIDLNMHMNNGRYLTMVDLMIVEFFGRTAFLKALFKNKWYPVLGGACITYRRELKFAEKYSLRFFHVGSDEHWNYLRFEYLNTAGQICAVGYSKGAAKSRAGLVRNAVSYAAMGIEFDPQPLPAAVQNWIEAEKGMIAPNPVPDARDRHQEHPIHG